MISGPARYILTLGEGDFSFSLYLAQSLTSSSSSLCGSRTQLIATSFDTRLEIQQKFGEDAIRTLDKVESLGCRVLHRIDATQLESYAELNQDRYDEIIFHHPHCGVEDAQRHRILLAHIFRSVSSLLSVPNGTVTISLADGQAERWALIEQVRFSSLVLLQAEPLTAPFNWRRHQGRSFQLIHRGNNSILQSSISFTFGHESRSNESIQWNDVIMRYPVQAPPCLFECDRCHKSYTTAQGLRTHLRSALCSTLSKSQLNCHQCDRTFGDSTALKSHQQAKHGTDPVIKPDWYRPQQDQDLAPDFLSCCVCRQTFSSMDLFRDHISNLQPSAPLCLPCDLCSKVFKTRHSLRQHLLHCRSKSLQVNIDETLSIT